MNNKKNENVDELAAKIADLAVALKKEIKILTAGEEENLITTKISTEIIKELLPVLQRWEGVQDLCKRFYCLNTSHFFNLLQKFFDSFKNSPKFSPNFPRNFTKLLNKLNSLDIFTKF